MRHLSTGDEGPLTVRTERRERRQRLHPHEREAVGLARQLGLYLLFEGDPGDRAWRVYAAPVGRCVGFYCSRTCYYEFLGRTGRADGWRDALSIAAGAAGKAVAR
jgi:hypothetical protein